MLELRAIVYGNVHGVGMRATVKCLADEMHLCGYVCNRPDGTVEIRAQGDKKTLDLLLLSIQKKFDIHHIASEYFPIKAPYRAFAII
jgi:acylphosphatase